MSAGYDIEAILSQVADSIRDIDRKVDALRTFLSRIEGCDAGCFSTQEVDATKQQIERLTSLRLVKTNDLASKIEMYESRVIELEKKLQVRKSIIDETEQAKSFEDTPELLNLLVREHSTMKEELDEARTFILS